MKAILKSIIIKILTLEAETVLRRFSPRIIAVTGTVGKTTMKDTIYSALSPSVRVRKSEKSYNSEIGVPLAILGLESGWNNLFRWATVLLRGALVAIQSRRSFPEWLVLEIGTNMPGDIRSLTRWVRPDVVVVTRLSRVPVHVEFFESVEDLIAEKASLVEAIVSGGTLVLNADDEDVMSFKKLLRGGKLLTFGTRVGTDFHVSRYAVSYDATGSPEGCVFRVDHTGNSLPISLSGVVGTQHVYPVAGALAVAELAGCNLVSAVEGIAVRRPSPGRMRIIPGLKGSVIIDDTYNSSPVALREALGVLENIKTRGRKILVLGDMMELGRFSVEEHRRAGQEGAKVADLFVTVGIRSRDTADAALGAGFSSEKLFQFDESREAGKFVEGLLQAGDVVLVKGSQAVRMERVAEEIMAEPVRAIELLVRQDDEWKRR